jgi:hypothetical protein
MFCLEGFFGGGVLLRVDKSQSTVVIHEYGSCAVSALGQAALLGQVALELGNKPHLARLNLIDQDALARLEGFSNGAVLGLGVPRAMNGLAKLARGTHWSSTVLEAAWDFTPPLCHCLELGKGQVAACT